MLSKYLPAEFEKKWVESWEKEKVYSSKKPSFAKASKGKQYILAMFPYPSGAGLHVGHVRNYTGTDVVARYFRMNGHSILHPMGWDAFGLPAENAAVKAKKNPMDMVPEHIATFKKQMKSLGFSYDWDREFTTTDPSYYKWTQWLFIQFYKMGLLYKKNAPINYCPKCKTGLAEEEVLADGTHERCGNKIEKRDLPQWVFRITMYADRLLEDLHGLDWPKGILEMQKNWIGKKEGINIKYQISNIKYQIECFTTTPVNFGATFLVVAPEHNFIRKILKKEIKIPESNYKEVEKYVKWAAGESEQERLKEKKEKTGAFTGLYAINHVTQKEIPIYVTDFVLATVGTGAVQGCPGHDIRDFKFAKKFNLPIPRVVTGLKGETGPIEKEEDVVQHGGVMVNSDFLNGIPFSEAMKKTMDYFEEKGWGKRVTSYHLRDWIFSRQRYWGEPIPMVFCEKCQWQPISEDQLPLKLPYVKSYEPTATGESPLSVIPEFVKTICPKCGGEAKRETDTMPNWAGSCWYFLAFAFWDEEARHRVFSTASPQRGPRRLSQKQMSSLPLIENWKLKIENSGDWLPVDWYLGGAEHAVLHLLYSRFWVKALYDLKLLNFKEPFLRLRNQGMILAEDHRKMSKSFNNVINPDDVISEFGADALRIYEMFMAPFNQEISWATKSLQGSYRFVKRIWDLYQSYTVIPAKAGIQKKNWIPDQVGDDKSEDEGLVIKLKKTIKKVTADIPEVKFNTSIAAMMEFLNAWENNPQGLSKENAKKFLQILAPFAPFLTEEIWHEVFGEKESVHLSTWPTVSGEIVEEEIILPVQVNGKLRETVNVQRSMINNQKKIEKLVLESEKVKKYVKGKGYRVIYVPGKILNFIVV